MKIRLAQFETFPASAALDIEVDQFHLDVKGIQRLEKGRLDLNIQESDDEYYCQGNLTVAVLVECARCLRSFTLEIDEKVSFIACSAAARDEHKGVEDSEEYVLFETAEMDIDLTKTISEAVLLGVPMKPICKEDCLGLCPQCGADMKVSPCDCDNSRINERWEGLKALSDKLNKTEG